MNAEVECEAVEMDVSPANLERLTEIHKDRYRRMIEMVERDNRLATNIRVEECRDHLRTWKSVEAAGFEWDKLDDKARGEITDAIEAGE